MAWWITLVFESGPNPGARRPLTFRSKARSAVRRIKIMCHSDLTRPPHLAQAGNVLVQKVKHPPTCTAFISFFVDHSHMPARMPMYACSLRLRRVKRETGSSHAYKCFVTKRKRISGGPATLCVTQKRDGAWNLAWKMTELQHDSCSSYTILVVLSSIGNLNAALYPHTHTHVALALAGKQKKKPPQLMSVTVI